MKKLSLIVAAAIFASAANAAAPTEKSKAAMIRNTLFQKTQPEMTEVKKLNKSNK